MIYLACDHNGVEKMKFVKDWLTSNGYEFVSVGADEYVKTDSYVDYVKLANAEVCKDGNMGVYMCGTGVGASIAANRCKGIRAVLCNMPKTAYFSRLHNNANVLVLSGGYKGYPKMSNYKLAKILKTFFQTEFEGDRHIQRVKDLDEMYN